MSPFVQKRRHWPALRLWGRAQAVGAFGLKDGSTLILAPKLQEAPGPVRAPCIRGQHCYTAHSYFEVS